MEWNELPIHEDEPGKAMVKHTAIGFNMIDTYYRKGLYPMSLPAVIGCEAAGVVEDIPTNNLGLKAGDRVVYATPPPLTGAYSQERFIEPDLLIKLPDGISDEIASSSFLKGLTAYVLVRKTYEVKQNDTILVYAAAGGVGSILCQWASTLGARVIGVVGSEEKVATARQNGCAEVIDRTKKGIAEAVLDLTDGEGVPVVYDSLGKDTFETSLDCLKTRGLMVSYGNATGAVPPFDILDLMRKGSLYLTRPQFYFYLKSRLQLEYAAKELFDMILSGTIKINVQSRYALKDVKDAHIAAESGKTIGATVLLP